MSTLPKVTPADHVPGPTQGHWTYDDYVTIPEDGKRYEVVDGVLFMTPAPNMRHQEIAGEIFAHLRDYIKLAGLGKVYIAPVDVELKPQTVIQPDVMVILNTHLARISDKRIIGAPDLVIEITSPATREYDYKEKLDLYAYAGVPEYWIVDPGRRTIEVLVLANMTYSSSGLFHGQQTLPSTIVPDLSIPVAQFFF